MPYSFDIVNKVAKKFKNQEQRVVHTTPKSFLELLSLYQNLLASKQTKMMAKINRLSDGLDKLRTTAATVEEISEKLEEQLLVANEKKASAEEIAENVAVEKATVDEENAAAQIEEGKRIAMFFDVLAKNNVHFNSQCSIIYTYVLTLLFLSSFFFPFFIFSIFLLKYSL